HATDLDPLHDEDVALMVEARAMRADELAGGEDIPRLRRADRPSGGGRVRIAQMQDDLVALVDEGHAPLQIGDDNVSVPLVEMARQAEAADEVDVLAIRSEPLQP